jgi:transcriptional regulator with XRE-family HTH domain
MSSALDEVAVVADKVADDQRRVARRARTMQRQRAMGWSWAKILDAEDGPPLVDVLRRSGRRLAEATGRLAQALAAGLTAEGESHRQVARRLGVTHQRISAMLKGERRTRSAADAGPHE